MASILSNRIGFAFFAALVFLVANAYVSLQAANTLAENNRRLLQTQEIINDVEGTLSVVKDAETGQRGYLLTGNEEFLAPYNSAMSQIEDHISRLKQATFESGPQFDRVERLETAIRSRIETINENIRYRRQGGLDEVLRRNTLGQGKSEMDEIRRLVQDIHAEEETLLRARQEQSRVSNRNTVITFLAANGIAIALLGFTYFLTKRALQERVNSEAALRKAHDELENRVVERTAELHDSNQELERSNRELQDFAFVASHDLQEPLRKIQAFGDRLVSTQGALLNEQGRDYLDRMHNAAGRMHTLINDLLTFSRVTTKAQPFEPTDLNKVAAEVLGDLETTIEQSGGEVRVGDLPVIEADEMQMRQLLQNLVANALKFRKADSPASVAIESKLIETPTQDINGSTPKDFVCITVNDNGIGFDEKYLDRIFTPFQRLHGRNEYEGTGIGLAVCRKIVERHGGTLTAKSAEGEGATFIATLPVKQSKEK